MLPIKSFLPPSNINTANNCTVCGYTAKLTAQCYFCNNSVCKNNCSYLILPQDAQTKPWLSGAIGKNVCLNCMPKTSVASENYIKKVFAEIFSSDNLDITNQNDIDKPELQNSISASKEELMDDLIGGILKDLNHHNRLQIDEKGQLTSKSISDIFNSLKQLIINASNTN